jgi:hypothetical protein
MNVCLKWTVKVEVSLGETHMEMPTSVDAGDVTFTVTNVGSENRGFKVSGPGLERSLTAPLPPGDSEKMTVNLKPGVYHRLTAARVSKIPQWRS